MQELHSMFTANPTPNNALYNAFQQLSQREPKLRRREIAKTLKVPEAALIEQGCGLRSIRLCDKFAEIICDLPSLGYILTLTRNDSAVHERKGVYDNVKVHGMMGLVISSDKKIDVRIMLSRWHSGFAVYEEIENDARYSLQFFDQYGVAIQKIYLQPESDLNAFSALLEKYTLQDSEPLIFSDKKEMPTYAKDQDVDREMLLTEWQKMTNVHQFINLLKKHQVSREQAFNLVGAPLAQPFDPARLGNLLQHIADTKLSIMCFVGNHGHIQIHTGPIQTVKTLGPWLNILDPEFNLHLLESQVAHAWLVRKPSSDGNITSLELYDVEGETIAQFFGQRMEGNPENTQWRTLAESALAESVIEEGSNA